MRIGNRDVGPGNPVYFVAEAGSNHDRKLDQALRLIDVAAEAGADAVKFQTFRADRLYPRGAGTSDYLAVPRSIYDIIHDLEMPLEWLPRLAEHSAARGVDFLSTPFDEASADALAELVPAYKIASYEMTHHGLLQHCAKKGKPLIVSTGTATLDEVREMVEAARAVGCRDLLVMQCTAKYPAPLTALNLRSMQTMARELNVLVGFSDHSREPLPAPMAAVALGAKMIEKHFTLDNHLPGPDHAYALEPHELAEVIRMVRAVEKTLGSGVKEPQPEELELRAFARRSVFTIAPIGAGQPLTFTNSAVLRRGKLAAGAHPAEYVRLLGRKAGRPIETDSPISADLLEPLRLGDGEVALRPMANEDAPLIVRWRNQPEVAAQLFSEHPPTLEDHQAWFANLQRRSDRLEFVIVAGDKPVGTIGLSQIDFGARSAEYGILIGEEQFRGRGIAGRASKLLLQFAFEVLDLAHVDLALFRDNEGARRLYEKLGFVEQLPAPPAQKQRPVMQMRLAK
jgi:N-acetylneuraminate synthase